MDKHSRLSLYSSAIAALKREGLAYLIKQGIKYAKSLPMNYLWFCYYKIFMSSNAFEFEGRQYRYYFHPYGTTWKNERSIEIPIIWEIVKNSYKEKKRVLEVGNVLSYRFNVTHDILDKYEKKEGIINQDIVDFLPSHQYDTIVSISTLEHVGWDEEPRDSNKVLRAVQRLRSMLAPGGMLVITLPVGQNTALDQLLNNRNLEFKKQHYMKRMGKLRWRQVAWNEIKDVNYNFKIPSATGLIIGFDLNLEDKLK